MSYKFQEPNLFSVKFNYGRYMAITDVYEVFQDI